MNIINNGFSLTAIEIAASDFIKNLFSVVNRTIVSVVIEFKLFFDMMLLPYSLLFEMNVNNLFLQENNLDVELLGSGYTWLDTGTPDSLLEASNFIQTIEKRQGKKVACLEEIAFNRGYINSNQLNLLAKSLKSSEYGSYLLNRVSIYGLN